MSDNKKNEIMEMEDEVVKVEIEICLTTNDIDEIMCAALEGGINYWCGCAEVVGEYLGEYASEQIARGGELKLYDIESPDVYTLTKEKFINGFKKFIADGRPDIVDHGMIDTSQMDSSDADVIVQYALFNEVVYG